MRKIKLENDATSMQGFTLVELAIVLIVIGLLLGMAFKGKSLVDAAKAKSDVNKYSKLATAVSVYYSKYGVLPGTITKDTPGAAPADIGTLTSKTLHDAILKDGLLKSNDFELSNNGKAYLHVVGCEHIVFAGVSPVENQWLAVKPGEGIGLCVYRSTSSFDTIKSYNDNIKGAINENLPQYEVCQMEVLLDDKSLTSGDGRRSWDAPKRPDMKNGFNCSAYSKAPVGSVNDGGGYLFRIF